MLFHSGCANEDSRNIGINRIHFASQETDVLNKFRRSLWYITGMLNLYDIERYKVVNDIDVFFLYYSEALAQEESSVADRQSVINELDIIMSGNSDNIINPESAMIKDSAEGKVIGINNGLEIYVSEKIFWDTLNNFIIVIGKEQLRILAYILEEERYRQISSARG